MKISTKGRYGLEALMQLCLKTNRNPVSLKQIVQRSNISEAYILQIFLVLRRAGIVDSIRGAQGGYSLSRDPTQITVGEVLDALEGPLSLVSCVLEGCRSPCSRTEKCATRPLWDRIVGHLNSVVYSITLADLVEHYLSLNTNMYCCEDYCI